MQQFISTIGMVLTMVFLNILLGAARRGKPITDPGSGYQILRHTVLVRGFAVFAAFGIPIGITALVIVNPPKTQDDYVAVYGMYALFAALSTPLLWESTRFALIVCPEGLDYRSPWRGRQFMRWEEVEQVSYNRLLSWFVVRAVDGRTFRVSVLVTGLNAFLEACESRLSAGMLKGAEAGYLQLGRPFRE